MARPRTIDRETRNRAAMHIRRAYPNGLNIGELASRLNVNPSTLRTGGYLQMLLAEHKDLYRDRGRLYNDGERTAILLSLRAARVNGETEWALELQRRWDELQAPSRCQTSLRLEEDL